MKRACDRQAVVFTCEHATCFVPKQFEKLFAGRESVLRSHRGWDPGTLDLGNALAGHYGFPLFATKVSRLLVEVNRSLWHRQLFSEFSGVLDAESKQTILNRYYDSHRNAVGTWIESQISAGARVLHLSLHSFTPILNGVERNADIGLLYDPRRLGERDICERWNQNFGRLIPHWRVRKNYPYLGRSDGFTTFLRKRFNAEQYCGIELEINQRLVLDRNFQDRIPHIVKTIEDIVD